MSKLVIVIIVSLFSFKGFSSVLLDCNCANTYSVEEINNLEFKLAESKDSINLLIKLSNIYRCKGLDSLALTNLSRLDSLNANLGESGYIHGLILSKIYQSENIKVHRNQLHESVEYFFKSIHYDFKKAESYYALGVIYERLGELNSSLFYYNKAIEDSMKCYPNTPYIRIVNIYLKQYKVNLAYNYYSKGKVLGNKFEEKISFTLDEYWNNSEKEKLYNLIYSDSYSKEEKVFLVKILHSYEQKRKKDLQNLLKN